MMNDGGGFQISVNKECDGRYYIPTVRITSDSNHVLKYNQVWYVVVTTEY